LSSPVAAQHLRELAERKSKAYELLILLEQNPSAGEACFHALGRVIDHTILTEVALDPSVWSGVVSAPSEDLAADLAGIDSALAATGQDRGRTQLLLRNYPAWMRQSSPVSWPHLRSILPKISPMLDELGAEGIEVIIECFNGCGSAETAGVVSDAVATYAETAGDIVRAAAELSSLFLRTGSPDAIAGMLRTVTPEQIFDSKDARGLLPAIAKLKVADDPVWSTAAEACIISAGYNHSTALNLARTLSGVLARLRPEIAVPYALALREVVASGGISLIGFATKQLPAMFESAGAERAATFVSEGCSIARKYGRVAAQEFFEQKTSAAKQAAPAQ